MITCEWMDVVKCSMGHGLAFQSRGEGGGGWCSCGSETPTLNKGKHLVKSRPLYRDIPSIIYVYVALVICKCASK